MRTLLLPLLAAAALGLSTACAGARNLSNVTPTTGVTEVAVRDMSYRPPVMEVPAGTTVTWRFDDGILPHDVQGRDFQSEVMRSGTFRHTFATPGSYDYACNLHDQMTGRVIVKG
jgi:plastocyanin